MLDDVERILISKLANRCYQTSASKGFWDAARNKGEMIALMHSELSEMLEGIRKPAQDHHCPQYTSEEVELADLIIRALDYAGGFELDLAGALDAKMRFNKERPHLHGKKF